MDAAANAVGVGLKPPEAAPAPGQTPPGGAAPAPRRAVAAELPVPEVAARPAEEASGRPRPGLARMLLQMSPANWAYLDVAVVAAATYLTYHLLVFGNLAYRWVVNPWLGGAAFCACLTVSGIVFGLYERDVLESRSRILARAAMTLALGITLAFAGLSLFLYEHVSRWQGLIVALCYAAVAVPLRLAAHHLLSAGRLRLLCVGCDDSIHKTVALLARSRRPHFQIVGHLGTSGCNCAPARRPERGGRFVPGNGAAPPFEVLCPRIGALEQIGAVLEQCAVDEVVVAAELAYEPAVERAVLAALQARCRVIDQPTFIEKLLGEVPAEHITAQWFLLADLEHAGGYDAVKRIVDVAAALVGLALTLPLWPLIMLAIRLDSRGPALYRQVRVGRHGRRFRMYKFRTMHSDAEAAGACWAAPRDGRVTRVGRLLRRSRLDELPQLWNILAGDMALVGPRPERPEFVALLSRRIPHYEQRHLIKPGLTGWAQIHYPYGGDVEDARRKLCYDLYYLKRRAIDLDLAIIIRTLGTFLLGAR